MSSNYGTGKTTAVLTGSVSTGFPTPTANQTFFAYSTGAIAEGIVAGTGKLIYDTPAGKKSYITGFGIYNFAATGTYVYLYVGTSAGTRVFAAPMTINTYNVYTFTTPIEFNGDVWIDVSVSQNYNINLNGYSTS